MWTLYAIEIEAEEGNVQTAYTVRPDEDTDAGDVVKAGFASWQDAWDWHRDNIEHPLPDVMHFPMRRFVCQQQYAISARGIG